MSNYFIKAFENSENRRARTENGAVTNKSTKSSVVDFFGLGGALRTRDRSDILKIFTPAFSENPLLALKTLFYLRDIRDGQGERRTFRVILNYLCENYPDIVRKNLDNVSFFGRFDDLFCAIGTRVEKDVFVLIKDQLLKDIDSENPSILAKWLKSENTSSKESKAIARKTREYLGWSSKRYRKTLSALRKKINIVESLMTSKKWGDIDYEKVTSRASMIYAKAFGKHDTDRYVAYLDSVKSGEKKINASTLYPYDIVAKVLESRRSYGRNLESAGTLKALWNALPNYVNGDENGLVIADVSGSMSGLPMAVSISLALYFAERNTGAFKDYFMTFSTKSELVKARGSDIVERVNNIDMRNWEQSTNIQKAFERILDVAVKNRISESDMPTRLYIVSDMEFDTATSRFNGWVRQREETNYEAIRAQYKRAGYTMPQIVFWNVNARNTQTPITVDDKGVCLVSGCSPTTFKNLLGNKNMTPYDVMLEILEKDRYSRVVI